MRVQSTAMDCPAENRNSISARLAVKPSVRHVVLSWWCKGGQEGMEERLCGIEAMLPAEELLQCHIRA